ncbi:MAG: DsbA family oxidoreductase [Burkholderiaceae bacterium]
MKIASCHIEVVSDIVCPWCYVGLGQLRQALAQIEPSSVGVTVSWSPFMLNPGLPEEGISRHDYLVHKFGEAGLARYARVLAYARQAGLNLNLDEIKVQPNTLDGHVLVAAAGDFGSQMVEHFFEGFFLFGRDLSQRSTLLDIAEKAGMQRQTAEAALNDAMLRKRVSHIAHEWQEKGVDGVPAFRIVRDESKESWLYGAVGAELLRDAILST